MSRIQGVVVGIVKSVDDPQKLGRVEVNLPVLSDNNRTFWARIATFMAGPDRGGFFMPELDDEVLVAFENGDPQHPYVIGFLWSSADKPPLEDDDIDTRVRRLRTVSNHRIDFDDRGGNERVYLQSKSEHKFELQDAPKAFSRLETKGQNLIKLDDDERKVTIKTASTPQIVLSDSPPKIEASAGVPSVTIDGAGASVTINVGGNQIVVSASGVTITAAGPLNVTCGAGLNLNAGGALNITAGAGVTLSAPMLTVASALASFAGVVQASSIVSPVYTPGVGNLI